MSLSDDRAALILDARLAAAASYVRRGSTFADVGSDHGYLPIYLTETGAVASAIASDISRASLGAARRNVAARGLEDKIKTVVCDGIAPLAEYKPTDIALCGMGGELIAALIERADFVRNPAVRLILQPMSRPHMLRRYLASAGFKTVGEKMSAAAGRIYFCICAEYDGRARTLSPTEEYLGRADACDYPSDEVALICEYAEHLADIQARIALSKETGGKPFSEETELISAIKAFLKQF